ncbi:hypothetical protein NP233_g10141 [Leucocoprinus birnbaumii]|uniref:Uncharacterized protein n=1 Tax=Leucocoprinus birnbaumii TaxID=56174 RepID=A0AAD5VIV4_9AGAR|nr:hypothetical protein NP233_g10141 [Leucocoprinus birnbaumii]
MFHTGILNHTELNGFLSLHTIQELELFTEDRYFFDDIDDDVKNDHGLQTPPSLPGFFATKVFAPFLPVYSGTRPITHELFDEQDEIVALTKSGNNGGVPWPTPLPATEISSVTSFNHSISPNAATPEDDEDNWVDFAAVQRQLKQQKKQVISMAFGFRDNESYCLEKWNVFKSVSYGKENRCRGFIQPRPIWATGQSPSMSV